jgi:hypothetical protein
VEEAVGARAEGEAEPFARSVVAVTVLRDAEEGPADTAAAREEEGDLRFEERAKLCDGSCETTRQNFGRKTLWDFSPGRKWAVCCVEDDEKEEEGGFEVRGEERHPCAAAAAEALRDCTRTVMYWFNR